MHEVQDGHLRTKLEQLATKYIPEDIQQEVVQSLEYLPSKTSSEATNVIKITPVENNDKDLLTLAKTTGSVALSFVGKMFSVAILVVLIPFYFFLL